MNPNLKATVFVYRHRKTDAITALYTEDARAMGDRPDYEHVATLEPRMWIEAHFDDAAKERKEVTRLLSENNPRSNGTATVMYYLDRDEAFDDGWLVAVETKLKAIRERSQA